MLQQRSGFTLLELLVVVLIIAVLAAVAMPDYLKAAERSRATETITMLEAIAKSQQRKYMQTSTFAKEYAGLDIQPAGATGSLYYTKGNAQSGEGCNGFGITLYHPGNYEDGYAEAVRYAGGQVLRYPYSLRRYYASAETTCLSDQPSGQALCADLCGIDTPVAACCTNGSPSACNNPS